MITIWGGIRRMDIALFFLLVLLGVCAAVAMSTPPKVAAQAGSQSSCRVLLMVDRSASIGDNWGEMRTQIDGLFTAPELQSESVALGYWTFSNVTNPGPGTNYNAPYHSYVDVVGDASGYASFMNTLPLNQAAILGGQTNYEQAFGYNNMVANNSPGNSGGVGSVEDIRNDADVLVLLTDGLPNYPVNSGDTALDGNATAVTRGHAARENYAGKTVIGAYITTEDNPDLSSLNATINGNPSDQSNVGPLEFSSIEGYLTDAISNACNVETVDYSLEPVVNADNVAVQTGDTVNFGYTVNNVSADNVNGTSAWQLYDVIINPTVAGNPLNFSSPQSACSGGGGRPYCNGIDNCAEILAMIGGRGSCNAVPTGGRGTCATTPSTSPGTGSNTFMPGPNAFYSPPRCQTIEDLPLGTRICSMLSVSKPTFGSSPSNRISNATCVTIGKTPLVQIHGGDLRVGRHFNGDEVSPSDPLAGVYTSRFKITKEASVVPNGRTYGSWVEYGVLAPGPIERIASLSGYAGQYKGYDDLLATGCDINVNKLTFANVVGDEDHSDECGYFSESTGLIPDVISALTSRTEINPGSYTTPLRLDQNSTAGLYRNVADDAQFEISTSSITKGKTFIVYVPNGTVTISDNITAANDTYANIGEIPQLIVIAKDINIRENVVRVDAWLVAKGDSSDSGVIDTCTGFASPLSSAVCNQPLRINGPVMASKLELWRTRVEATSCQITAPDDCQSVGDPAEVMNLSGSSVLWALGYGLNSSRAQTTYTIELPPYY